VVSVTPRPRFAPGEMTPPPGTRWTGGRVGPRDGLDTEARGKILLSLFVSRAAGNDFDAKSCSRMNTCSAREHMFALVHIASN
jgi:hypothetical protein